MTLSDEDFAKLQAMQELCTSLEKDVQRLRTWRAELTKIHQRYVHLSKLYQADWQRLVVDTALPRAERESIESLVPPGHHSIFWQDTIWNALSDASIEYMQLLKSLARKISAG